MKIEEQVVSLDLAREMQKLGAPQDSVWYWTWAEWNGETEWVLRPQEVIAIIKKEHYSAYTVAELGKMLPKGCWSSGNIRAATDDIYYCGFINISEAPEILDKTVYHNTEADARAKMWIYLKKEGSI